MNKLPEEDLHHIYLETIDIWESFRNKSIFLTGGTGFFGKWFLESFIYVNEKLALNASITTLSRDPENFLLNYPFYKNYSYSVHFVKGDILTFDFDVINNFNYIIHAATAASESLNNSNPLLMMDTITIGTRKVLDFALTQKLDAFLFISSGAIYGKQPSTISHIKEDDCFKIDINNSKSAYAEGKRIAELYCSTYFEKFNIPLKIARCFAFVGPYLPLNTHFAIGNFINNVLKNEDIIIKGDASTVRSYMYPSDLMIWLWMILLNGELNSAYNVGSDIAFNMRELANFLLEIEQDSSCEIKILGNVKPENEVDKYVPNISKSKLMKLNLTVDLKEALIKTIKFNKNVK